MRFSDSGMVGFGFELTRGSCYIQILLNKFRLVKNSSYKSNLFVKF